MGAPLPARRKRQREEHAFEAVSYTHLDVYKRQVVCHLQQRLEKQADMTAAFQACTEPEREMYALYYLCEDGVQKLSRFFRINGEPLLSLAPRALRHIDAQEEARIAAEEYELSLIHI